MGGGSTKPQLTPCPEGYSSDLSSFPPPDSSGNYQLILTDGKENDSYPLKWEGKPIIIGRSESQGSTYRSNDDGTSALHLDISWDDAGKNWVVKDLGSKRGTNVITSNTPVKLPSEGPAHVVTGPSCFHCGTNTFVTLIPAVVKGMGLECTKLDVEEPQKFKKGDFIEIKKTMVFGRAADSIGRPVIFHNDSNVSGSHSVFSNEGKYWIVTDSNATHKTVAAGTKLCNEGMIGLWPGAEVTFGHKEKSFKEPTIVWVVKMLV
mmetsp:Transcript_3802/g.7673  ORF Transcript_3802/g.7673 Transcript_3802/m.7673 type:complete len:262 (-) Transcript_3802:92-877(-)|eukprot:CAMPEP_0118654914 /NCGR_PEP_ID=MMETSP0785-20121206/12643_1 /TAXON_ID=91992 /ORGANISM="Bolidomonas pacifica, Strain CCMP 1866" /LENGTH=261 /DNA_ID=CAMNT_0006547605 /DNA_START=122 /DNA_END=907 /DNA_ORIENTATION=-